jgi:hypothetical protein
VKRPSLVRFLPDKIRARYGNEIEQLLATSDRPAADLFDVVRQGSRWHLEALMRKGWRTGAVVLAAVSMFALGYAVNGLAGGLTELPRHWWSTAPLLGLMGAGVLGAVSRFRDRAGVGR